MSSALFRARGHLILQIENVFASRRGLPARTKNHDLGRRHERLYNGDKRQNVAIELRFADWKLDRLPDLAAELVALKVDVIVALGTPAARAAKQTTSTIPIGTTYGNMLRLARSRVSAKARLRSSEYGFGIDRAPQAESVPSDSLSHRHLGIPDSNRGDIDLWSCGGAYGSPARVYYSAQIFLLGANRHGSSPTRPGMRDRLVSVGRYALRGVAQPQELFTLDSVEAD